jgi:hypothetical protein
MDSELLVQEVLLRTLQAIRAGRLENPELLASFVLGTCRNVTWDKRRAEQLLCGDLFTQAGSDNPPLTEGDILAPSEGMRKMMDYFSHSPSTRHHLERLAAFEPRVLACMHGSAFAGDGGRVLRELADALAA